jgi:hypothetical protein
VFSSLSNSCPILSPDHSIARSFFQPSACKFLAKSYFGKGCCSFFNMLWFYLRRTLVSRTNPDSVWRHASFSTDERVSFLFRDNWHFRRLTKTTFHFSNTETLLP